MKTVRFAELVAKAGAPATHQMWLPPGKDAAFQRALTAHRVLTVHQENVGTKRDYGVVGFHEEPHAQFLVFPRSIREFEGRRVVGVNYELLAADSRPEARRIRVVRSPGEAKPARKTEPTAERRSRGSSQVVRFELPAPGDPRLRSVQSAQKPVTGETASKPMRSSPRKGRARRHTLPAERRMLAEVARALRELESGKNVAAYKRLQRMLDSAGDHAG